MAIVIVPIAIMIVMIVLIDIIIVLIAICILLTDRLTSLKPYLAGRRVTGDPLCACVRVRAHARACVRVRVCACASARARDCVRARLRNADGHVAHEKRGREREKRGFEEIGVCAHA